MKNKVDKGQHYQCQQPLRGLFVRNKVLGHEGEICNMVKTMRAPTKKMKKKKKTI
jgi:hypothetical protein